MALELQVLIIAVGGFFLGIVSGIVSGGIGSIMVPLAIAVGLPPQIAVGTLKMGGLGAAFGGLTVFWKSGHVRKDILRVMVPIGISVGLMTPFIFQRIDSETFQTILGIVLIIMAPTLLIKKKELLKPSRKRRGVGYVLYSFVLFLQAVFGSGAGSLANFILILLFGTTKLETNATKRAVTAFLVPITFVGLLLTGYVSLIHGIPLLIASFIGTHIGSKIALKQGEEFVTYAMFIVALAGGIWVLI